VNDDSRKTSLQVKWENYMMANRNKEFQKTVSDNLVVFMGKVALCSCSKDVETIVD
jgi:hypothetical protein